MLSVRCSVSDMWNALTTRGSPGRMKGDYVCGDALLLTNAPRRTLRWGSTACLYGICVASCSMSMPRNVYGERGLNVQVRGA